MKTIFVSSTFKDMQYERDAIRDHTAPILNKEAKKYGDEVDFCDLRWGINTGDLDTEEGSKKVLDVCLDEIDRSEPPMVVLLGYRYGWIPDAGLIKTAADRKHLELEDLERSVTALEIEYGALCDKKKLENTLFYFRKIEGDAPSDYLAEDREHEEKILALKNRIKSITGANFREYPLKWNGSSFDDDGVKDFAQMLAEDIKKMLMREWLETEKLTEFQRERRTHAAFIREKNVMFRARQAEAEKLMEDALSQPVTIIKGEVGSGKSTLFCHMATELRKSEWTVLPFISGLTMESNSARDIIENTVYFIEEELHLEHFDLDHCIDEADSQASDINLDTDNDEDEADSRTDKKKKYIDRIAALFKKMCLEYAESGAKLLIMVDAADQLAQDEEIDWLRFIPMSVSEDIHFVMTCTMDFETPGREHYTLRQLDDEDKLDVMNGILARSGKEISQPVINEMLKLKASASPLYLSLLVQRLLMMNREDFADIRSRGDGMTAIEQYQLELIRNKCPDDLDEMSAALLSEAGKRINEKLVSRAAQYLALSRNGLRRKDIATLLGEEWSEIDFSHFVSYMSDCFLIRDDGRYDFTHKSIRAGFRRLCEDPDAVNRDILEYFKSLEADDPVRMSEIIYHVIAADDKKFFIDYIIDHESDSHIMSITTRNIYVQCITDYGRWIIKVLNEAKEYEADERLCTLANFCNFNLNDAFGEDHLASKRDLGIKLSILLANIKLLQHLYISLTSDVCAEALFHSCRMAAEIYPRFDDLKRALELYEMSISIKEQQVLKLYQLYELYETIPPSNEQQAEKFRADIHKIFFCSQDDTAMETLSKVYCDAAGLYRRKELDRSDFIKLSHAAKLYAKDLTIRELLAEKPSTSIWKHDLSSSYRRTAGIYEALGDNDNMKRALELHEKNLPLEEALAGYRFSDQCDLAYYHEEVAGLYMKLGSSDNVKRALELHEKSLSIREALTAKYGYIISEWDLSFSYDRAAGIYEELGGCDNIKRALELYEKSLAIREHLVGGLGIAQDKWLLFFRYIIIAGIYEELGGSDNMNRALELREKDLTIWEHLATEFDGCDDTKDALTLYEMHLISKKQMPQKTDNTQNRIKKTGTTQNKNEFSISYRKDDKHDNKGLGNGDSLLYALELYEKDLARREQLAAELSTVLSKRLLSLSYINAAEIYEGLNYRFSVSKPGRDRYPIVFQLSWQSHNAERALELYDKSLAINEQLADELGNAQSKRDLSLSYYVVARTYEEHGRHSTDRWRLGVASELYKKGLTISEQLADELGNAQSKRDLSLFYYTVAGINMKPGDDSKLKPALELYEKGLTISEQLAAEPGNVKSKRELSGSYYYVAQIYKELDGSDNIRRALELYEKSLTNNEQLAAELDTAQSKRELSGSYYYVAQIYESLYDSDYTKRALELYEKNLTINKQLAKELGTKESKMALAGSYDAVAGIYDKLGGSDNQKQALKLYKKNLAVNKQLAKELDTEECKSALSFSYGKCAANYEELGGGANLKRALKLYEKELTIREQLAAGLDADQRKWELSYDYCHIAEIYKELGGHGNLKRALKLYEKNLAIDKQLSEEQDTAQNKNDLSWSYGMCAGICEKLGGRKNLAQALDLYHKALAISESLADTLQTPDAYDNLAVCLLMTARHPSTSTSDKKTLLSRCLKISKELYEKTNLDEYKEYIDECEKLLSGC